MLIFQWSSHHQVIEPITIQIRDRSEGRAKASVLDTVVNFQRSFKEETILRGRKKRTVVIFTPNTVVLFLSWFPHINI